MRISTTWTLALGWVWIAAGAAAIAGPTERAAAPDAKGSLVIIGGALRYGESEVWSRVVDLAGGPGARIAVFPTASSVPEKSSDRVMDALRRMGAHPFLVPIVVRRSPSPDGATVAVSPTVSAEKPPTVGADQLPSGAKIAGDGKPMTVKPMTVKPMTVATVVSTERPLPMDKAADKAVGGKAVADKPDTSVAQSSASTAAPPALPTKTRTPAELLAGADSTRLVADPDWIAQVRSAGGVFFTGGQQKRITETLYDKDGHNTPMLDAVWEVYRKGGVVAGTSAGAAVMSRIMYRDAKFVLSTLQNGVRMGKEIDRGLGFLDPAWFVEQHCLARGRFARALVVMQSQGIKFGVGVDENTALVVRGDGDAKVIGYKGALVMDLSAASHDAKIEGFNVKNVKLTYLDRGDSFNLRTLVLTPSAQKQAEVKIDPNSPTFRPEADREPFATDILGNTAATDLLFKLIGSRHNEAIGLAFDGREARGGPAQGFEFRFYRERDSVGWYTGAFGGDDYTVANIHLDIRPVTFQGPLYK